MKKIIISGGGTGGHVFPAVAIANRIKLELPNAEILFIGAEGKMEMEKVPAAGYKIIGLPIRGLQRKFDLKNFLLPFKILKSLIIARKEIKRFQPDVVVGVGGYASGPTLQMATMLKIPAIIQEQNSFAGKTNIILGKRVQKVCVAYNGMEKFFPMDKLVFTGNPVRSEMVNIDGKKDEANTFFKLDPNKKTVFVVGGSLGARTLNDATLKFVEAFDENNVQVIWQCGKNQFQKYQSLLNEKQCNGVKLMDFISRMDLAYAAADFVISRAGAIAVSELCIIGKPTILVPSPNVAEDHQTKNALALVENNAALYVKDNEAVDQLWLECFSLINDVEKQKQLIQNIQKMAVIDADARIVETLKSIAK